MGHTVRRVNKAPIHNTESHLFHQHVTSKTVGEHSRNTDRFRRKPLADKAATPEIDGHASLKESQRETGPMNLFSLAGMPAPAVHLGMRVAQAAKVELDDSPEVQSSVSSSNSTSAGTVELTEGVDQNSLVLTEMESDPSESEKQATATNNETQMLKSAAEAVVVKASQLTVLVDVHRNQYRSELSQQTLDDTDQYHSKDAQSDHTCCDQCGQHLASVHLSPRSNRLNFSVPVPDGLEEGYTRMPSVYSEGYGSGPGVSHPGCPSLVIGLSDTDYESTGCGVLPRRCCSFPWFLW